GMDLEEAMLVLAVDEGEGAKRQGAAQPGEAAPAHIEGRAEVFPVLLADAALYAISGDDQVGGGQAGGVRHLHLETQVHPQVPAASLQDVEQQLAGHPAKTVARRG